jgi:fatty acid/phospholipid biosynthesis enzyme
VSVICHGSSTPNAFKNAIRIATQAVAHDLSAHIGANFARRESESRT